MILQTLLDAVFSRAELLPAISVHVDFKLVQKLSGQNANAGETIVLFCTGLGAVEGFSTAGVAGPSSPLARTSQTTTVSMDGRPAQVSYAGLVPGLAGLYQINFVVPVGVGGDVVTTISVGGVSSNPTTINVRGAYTLGASYSGTITSKAGNEWQLSVGPFASQSATLFTAPYSFLSRNLVVDRGSFQLQSTTAIFAILARSSVDGTTFVGILDTLDAGGSFFGLLYDTDSLDKVRNFDNWDANIILTLDAPVIPVIPPILSGVSATCASIEGAVIFSGDQFLGRVTANTSALDSIGNEYGRYGSSTSPTSIFNDSGSYGSDFSRTSAFYSSASNPPIISKGTSAAHLTTNQFKTPGIDPRALYSCIGRKKGTATVSLRVSGCKYFLADGPSGISVLQWSGGHDPDRGETIIGDVGSYGSKNVYYLEKNKEGRLYVDDYLLSQSTKVDPIVKTIFCPQ